MANRLKLELDVKEVEQRIDKLKSVFEGAVQLLAENGAQKMESYAKQNRLWHDRTGDARRRLKGSCEKTNEGYRIKIAHGVNYGVWLEFAHERRYAILKPTVEKVGYGEIIPAFNNFMDKIKL